MRNEAKPLLRVLLVEDDDTIALLASVQLARFDLYFERVRNGHEAVRAASSGNFDLILMDVQMPTLNGFQATVQIRSGELLGSRNRTRIVGVTSSDSREDCLSSGMDDFQRKPANYADILKGYFPACPLRAA